MTLPGPAPRGYRELADLLRRQIHDGTYPPGQRIPPETSLQETYGLARHTVRAAVKVLRDEGLVVVVRGYGAVVAERIEKEQVVVPAGTVVSARMPTLAERDEWGLPEGVAMLVGRSAIGETAYELPADRYEFVTE